MPSLEDLKRHERALEELLGEAELRNLSDLQVLAIQYCLDGIIREIERLEKEELES